MVLSQSNDNTSKAESTLQAASEPTSEPQAIPSASPTKEQMNDPQQPSSSIRTDQRRYGQIFGDSDRKPGATGDTGARSSSELISSDTNPASATKALYPPYHMRKRSCGGA